MTYCMRQKKDQAIYAMYEYEAEEDPQCVQLNHDVHYLSTVESHMAADGGESRRRRSSADSAAPQLLQYVVEVMYFCVQEKKYGAVYGPPLDPQCDSINH